MKAVYIEEQGGIENLKYGDLPDPEPGPGEILVRLHAAALNHLDVYARSGANRVAVGPFPHVLGCDMAGDVAALGEGVTGPEVGQRVVVDYVVKCGVCDYCAIGRDEMCRRVRDMGIHLWGSYAEYVVAPAANVYPVTDAISYDEAASIPLAFHTAWHCLVTRAGLQPGDTVLINAAGSGVGTAGIQVARALQARVLVTAGSDAKIEKAVELGAEGGINYTTMPEFGRPIREMANGDGVDIVFDSVGTDVWDESFVSLRRGGRLVNCGVTSGHRVNLHLGLLFTRGLTVLGSGGRSRKEFTDFMRLVNSGALRGVVGKAFPLEEAQEAHRLMEDRDFFGKIVLQIP